MPGTRPLVHIRAVIDSLFAVRPSSVAFIWLSLAAVTACSRYERTVAPKLSRVPRANVLLVTIDTLRRDRVGAFGSGLELTPAIDRLAADGVRYWHAYSHAPQTLPAHASILTGLIPRHTGVRNNTLTRLEPSTDTLAAVLKEAGYRTAAFVSAFVLDARFGLARGFDVYDDRLPHANTVSFRVAERSGTETLERAGDWILRRPAASTPWFAWVHLFEPHAPYAPAANCARGRIGYDGEVACVDAALGAWFDRLRNGGALDRTIVIVTADHGESLGEHGETTHGLFAYNATLSVPLFITGAGRGIAQTPVGHADIMPTVLDIVGISARHPLDGRSLIDPIGADRPIYFEALDGALTRGWAPLTGVVRGDVKYIDLPEDELYLLADDPDEHHNRVASDPRAAALRNVLREMTLAPAAQAPAASVDSDAAARLRSLGYVRGGAMPNERPTPADDPKRLVALNEQFNAALTAFDEGRAGAAVDAFMAVLRARPDFLTARTSAATALVAAGRAAEAVQLLGGAPPLQQTSLEWKLRMGTTLRESGRMREAAQVLESARADSPADSDVAQNLATVYAALGRASEARALFSSLTSIEHAPATTWYNAGLFELQSGRPREAARAFQHAVERDPSYGEAWNALGASLVERDPNAAIDAWRAAERLLPRDYDLLFNIGMLTADHASAGEALSYLRRFVDEAPRPRYNRDIARVERRMKTLEGGPR